MQETAAPRRIVPRAQNSIFPCPGAYSFAGRTEPVIVLGLGNDGEIRIVGADGFIRAEPFHRVRLQLEPAA